VIHFLAFSLQRAAEGLWRNRVMTLAATVTMILMLVLLASLVIVLSGMQAGLDFVESKVEVRAELQEGVPQERVDALRDHVAALPEVEGVTYVSKEEALAQFRARLADGQEDLTEVVGSNPLPAQLVVKLRDPREFGAVRSTLQEPSGVVIRVVEQQSNVDRLVSITGLLHTVGIIIIALVGLTVLLVVVNSIRMALMSRSDEIEIMRLVGASDAFVRWPFIFEGLLVGLLGALVTLGLLSLAAAPISQLATTIAGQVPVGFGDRLSSQVTAVVMTAGLGLGGFGAWLSVRAYLRP
jgi:cell division transport system permease protein